MQELMQQQIVNIARGLIGTPFRHLGRTPGIALDCAGVSIIVAKELGFKDIIDPSSYGRTPSNGLLESVADLQKCVKRVYRIPKAGDVLLIKFKTDPQHVAICAGDTIIHAWQNAGKVAEHTFSEEWRARVVRVYEFIEVNS